MRNTLLSALLKHSATLQDAYAEAKAAGHVELAAALKAHGWVVAEAIARAASGSAGSASQERVS